MGAEEGVEVEGEDVFEAGDGFVEVFVVAEDLDPFVEEGIAGEDPAFLGHEKDHLVVAMAGCFDDLCFVSTELTSGGECLGVTRRRFAPEEVLVEAQGKAVGQDRVGLCATPYFDAFSR